jgi:3-hydroxyisobutyrate dehydrogenase
MSDHSHIAFVGTGVMGRSMAGHLLHAGHPLHVHTRSKERASELLEAGATWHDSPGSAAAASEVVISIVGFPADVESVYLGENGIVAYANAGATLIDMTTSSPALAVKISEQAAAKGVDALDAPVSGGDVGAREARLSIMVGGDQEIFEKTRPVFERMGKNIVYQGPAGSGQHTKMCNQIAIASGMLGVCEALAYAEKSGLNPETVLASIGSGAAGSWSLTNLAPRILKGDYSPGFFVKHFIKDMSIAIESAEAMQLQLPGLTLAKQLYDKLSANGGENDGTQALFRLYGGSDGSSLA